MPIQVHKPTKPRLYVRLWWHPAVQQRWQRTRWWIARALEKLAEGG